MSVSTLIMACALVLSFSKMSMLSLAVFNLCNVFFSQAVVFCLQGCEFGICLISCHTHVTDLLFLHYDDVILVLDLLLEFLDD